MTIDAHVHFWGYNKKRDTWMEAMKTLHQDYLPEHFALTAKRNAIDGVVAVQADQSEVETRFLVELSKTHAIISGVVGWVDFRASDVAEKLAYFSQYPEIKGWRHVVQNEPPNFLNGADFKKGIAQLKAFDFTYDILVYHHQLESAIEFAAQFPWLRLVLDHCGKPDIKNKKVDEWKAHIQALAQLPNVCCKLSGLFTEAAWNSWSAADFYPYLDVVFNAFGTQRLMYGSDWPVLLVSGIYVQWKSLLEKYMENFPNDEREQVFGLNATQFYKL